MRFLWLFAPISATERDEAMLAFQTNVVDGDMHLNLATAGFRTEQKASASLRTAMLGDVRQVKDTMFQLATNETVDRTTKEMASFIKTNITGVHRSELVTLHNKTQLKINDKLELFTNCAKAFVVAQGDDVKEYLGEGTGKIVLSRSSHGDCRVVLKASDDNKTRACTALTDFIAELKKSPPPATVPDRGGELKFFEDLQNYIYSHKENWNEKEKLCKKYEVATETQLKSCNSKQADLEKKHCAFREQVHTTCEEQDECYIKAKEVFEATAGEVADTEQILVLEYVALGQVDCLVDVLASNEPASVRKKAAQACLGLAPDTDFLTITIPNVPGNEVCDYRAVQHPPCSEKYLADEYGDFVFINECSPCQSLPEKHFNFHAMNRINYKPHGTCPMVGAGHHHICAGDAATMTVKCAGDDNYGEITGLSGLSIAGVRMIQASQDFTIVLYEDGFLSNGDVLQAFGRNMDGNLDFPRQFPGKKIVGIHSGHYVCLAFDDGTLQCYGGWAGAAAAIATKFNGKLKNYKKLFGCRHMLCAINNDDHVECAGYNQNGELNVPSDLGKVSHYDCGCCTSCAVRASDGKLICWGYDSHGEVSNAPTDDLNPKQLVMAEHGGAIITADGDLKFWGHNFEADSRWSGLFESAEPLRKFLNDHPNSTLLGGGSGWGYSACATSGYGNDPTTMRCVGYTLTQ